MAYGLLMLLVVLAACGDPVASPPLPAPRARDPDAGESASPRFDVARPPPGVPDDGKTSGLVLLEVRGSAPCGAALIASNVALVPASCVLRSACRAVAPEALVLRSGDTSREVLPGAREIIAADPCERDALAAIVLDGQADGLAPFAPRGHPAEAGEHVRVVSFTAERPHLRLLRDHVTFREAERAVATLDAEGCGALPGAVAIDEGSGELVGLSAPVVTCASFAFLQLDAWRSLRDLAVAHGVLAAKDADGGVGPGGPSRRGKAQKPITDLHGDCSEGLQCAAGVCVLEGAAGYCSRPCGGGDRCPAGYRCQHPPAESLSACVAVR